MVLGVFVCFCFCFCLFLFLRFCLFSIHSSSSLFFLGFSRKYKNIPKPYIPSTEEITLRRIEEEKERLRQQIEDNRENIKRVFSGSDAILPVHSTKPLTTPEEPHFSARLEPGTPRRSRVFLHPSLPRSHSPQELHGGDQARALHVSHHQSRPHECHQRT